MQDGAVNMSKLVKIVGQRIRNYRNAKGLSQERLAELAGCHHTYIGQVERGEKNATIESLEKISNALNITISDLFEGLNGDNDRQNIPLECYEFLASQSLHRQEHLYRILLEIDSYTKC